MQRQIILTRAAQGLSVITGVAMLASGGMKIGRVAAVVENLTAVSVPAAAIPVLGGLELAAGVGSFAGLVRRPLGLAATSGAVVYFAGALLAHGRARDTAVAPAASMLALVGTNLALLVVAA